ncbi:MAG TPA: thioredoxin domain-containing protein [Verrucomicrobiae bacterium]|nr:thioredoxin domain-containing protein [Verrucomicrobiae bacterium]
MESSDRKTARFVDERLAALDPAADFRPDPAKALSRVEARDRRYRTVRRRWFWAVAAAAAVGLMALAAPVPCRAASTSCVQPMGARLWDSVFRKPVPPVTLIDNPAPTPVPATVASAAQPGPTPAPTSVPAPQLSAASPLYKWTGLPDAPIVCEIYSDFECPHCALTFLNVLPQFEAQFVRTGKVRLLHRDFPLRGHRYSMTAARYANAAGRAGVYETVVTRLFRTQDQWGNDGDIESRLAPVVPSAVLRQIHDLVQNHAAELDQSIDADMAMGAQDNISRTPSLVVVFGGNRQVIAGFPELDLLKGYLDDLVK